MDKRTRVADQVAEQVWGGAHLLTAIRDAGGEAVRIDTSTEVTHYRFGDGSEIHVDAAGGWDVAEEEEVPPVPPVDPELLGAGAHLFGAGAGWLPVAADEIARRHGARLLNAEDPTGPLTSRRRHWFVLRGGMGSGSTLAIERAVMDELRAAGIVPGAAGEVG